MRLLAAVIALAATLALARDAAAAEIRVTTPCIITSATSAPAVPIEGTGFTPGAELEVFTNGLLASLLDRPHADTAGAFSYELLTPMGEFGADHPAPLTVTDTAGVSASTTFLMVYSSFTVPRSARARRPVRVELEGFTADAPVYLFAQRRGRIRGVRRLGVAAGPCGTLTTRTTLLPPRAQNGVWLLGAGSSDDPRDVVYLHRVRKRGPVIRDLGEAG
jgi:hypothetical protein